MVSTTGLSKKQLGVLGQLKRVPAFKGFYLAGGSAVGWLYQHRRSADLDFFSRGKVDSLDVVVAALVDEGASVHAQTDVSAALRASGVPIDLVNYPYAPLKKTTRGPQGFALASPVDLAVMKLGAISRRGLRRDFWDLEEIARHGVALADAAAAYIERFGVAEADLYHVLRALTFFDDAEREPVLPVAHLEAAAERHVDHLAKQLLREGGEFGLPLGVGAGDDGIPVFQKSCHDVFVVSGLPTVT